MDTSLLRLFVAVMRRRSFAGVARDLDVDPSAISRAIASLEDELGVRLFHRTTRRLAPTEAAEAYFRRIEPLADDLDAARMAARDAGKQPEGILRVTSPVGFAQINILPLLPELVALYPGLAFDFVLTDDELDLIAERIDVAVRLSPFSPTSHVAYRLCRMAPVVCASPQYLARCGALRTPADLARHKCIVFRQAGYRSEWRLRAAAGDVIAVPIQARCIVSNALALRDCALLGLGPALVPRWIVGRELNTRQLVNIFPSHEATATEFGAAAAWLLYPSRAYLPLKVRVFVDFLKKKFRAGAPGEAAVNAARTRAASAFSADAGTGSPQVARRIQRK
ncbi:MAG: LysR family transcriptional regulator [Proteobacteria bacterium]|nr:LysR family transcriptional regulator [Pseudomonadota bacterium]